ncbi:MAG: DNA gyrase inhibitor YacG, partial [Burkholderiales bacterium]|nr:DNA gyrase inhibitor YacG [Burkholderiales bacterium]
CPHCGQPSPYDPSNPFRPFCCERCRLIDLGEWASESYRVPLNDGPGPDDVPTELEQ